MGIYTPPTATEWWDLQWAVTLGCTHVSDGCRFCTAEVISMFSASLQRYATVGGGWTGEVDELPDTLDAPALWTTPQWVFIDSISDLFHEKVSDEFIERVMETCGRYPEHHFGILTKRAVRMRRFFTNREIPDNVMVGVSVESPRYLDRVGELLGIDAGTRWISAEPLLAHLDLSACLKLGIDWVCAGPENGDNARPCDPDWMRQIRDDCADARIPFFTKSLIDDHEHRGYPP